MCSVIVVLTCGFPKNSFQSEGNTFSSRLHTHTHAHTRTHTYTCTCFYLFPWQPHWKNVYVPAMSEITLPWKYMAPCMSQENAMNAILFSLALINLLEQQCGEACFAFPVKELQHSGLHFRTEPLMGWISLPCSTHSVSIKLAWCQPE